MNKVLAVAVAALMIMAGMLIYHEINSPQRPRYNLNIGLNNTEIQNVTINNYAYHNIHSDWFNVTMAGYGNYTILFPYYVAYDGHINNTAQVYLAHNTTVLFNTPNITLRITTLDPNASLTFQQMIHLNRTTFPFINKAFSNIAFFYNNGTPIYAWLESVTNNNATLWLKLNGSVNRTVNIKIYGQTANEMSSKGYYGEAPELTATYGQYDNGANVFIQYGGKSWSSFTFVGGNWTTANGYLQQTSTTGSYSGGPAALIESTSYSNTAQYIISMAFSYTTQSSAKVGLITVATPTSTPDTYGYRFVGQQLNNGAGFISFLNDRVTWVVNNLYQGSVSTAYIMSVTNNMGTWSGNLRPGYDRGNVLTSLSPVSYTAANDLGATSGYVGISAAYNTISTTMGNPINVQWFYMRSYPPNGTMPIQVNELSSTVNITEGLII